ncbi:hypothetical protein SmJEL517_g05019 [Synchytrium microbalum]|uniref:Large ribosomal subunit protein uL29m n=1 Tax=Synchytrium microbalum TaxID=1806994 RepID=A0A507C146_9FUNG|nr:uncharacterized protein SmJEL517_g05019 [Synchytrium microbalum]TPX31706.1 hypothetical protein SmJEL517_g05019 [Synchytrium microbalum]
MMIRACLNQLALTRAPSVIAWTRYTSRTFTSSIVNRGLGEFFDDAKDGWRWKEGAPGRAWDASELRQKSFDDLHKLWFVCIKEQNLLASQGEEARRFRYFFPHETRVKRLRMTMSRIKLVLWERHKAHTHAMNIVTREKRREELKIELAEQALELGKQAPNDYTLERALSEEQPYIPPSPKVERILRKEQEGAKKPRNIKAVRPNRVINSNPSLQKFIV